MWPIFDSPQLRDFRKVKFYFSYWDCGIFFSFFFFLFFCFGVLKFEIFVWDFGWLGCNRSWGCDFENSILYVNDAA